MLVYRAAEMGGSAGKSEGGVVRVASYVIN